MFQLSSDPDISSLMVSHPTVAHTFSPPPPPINIHLLNKVEYGPLHFMFPTDACFFRWLSKKISFESRIFPTLIRKKVFIAPEFFKKTQLRPENVAAITSSSSFSLIPEFRNALSLSPSLSASHAHAHPLSLSLTVTHTHTLSRRPFLQRGTCDPTHTPSHPATTHFNPVSLPPVLALFLSLIFCSEKRQRERVLEKEGLLLEIQLRCCSVARTWTQQGWEGVGGPGRGGGFGGGVRGDRSLRETSIPEQRGRLQDMGQTFHIYKPFKIPSVLSSSSSSVGCSVK